MLFRLLPLTVVCALLAPAAVAQAVPNYPAPTKPKGATGKPKGPSHTFRVCKDGCRYRTIQKAVKAAGPGDTVRVGRGTYVEGVKIAGNKKRYLKLIGDVQNPQN